MFSTIIIPAGWYPCRNCQKPCWEWKVQNKILCSHMCARECMCVCGVGRCKLFKLWESAQNTMHTEIIKTSEYTALSYILSTWPTYSFSNYQPWKAMHLSHHLTLHWNKCWRLFLCFYFCPTPRTFMAKELTFPWDLSILEGVKGFKVPNLSWMVQFQWLSSAENLN